MEYTRLGTSGLKVSRIALGCMSFGDTARGFSQWALDEEAAQPFFRQAVELGITFWDTANVYSLRQRRRRSSAARSRSTPAARTSSWPPRCYFKMHDGPGGQGLSRKAIMENIDASLTPARHRLRRPLPDPPLRPGHPGRGDHGGAARRGEGRQGPLPRRLVDVGLAVREDAVHRARCNGWTRFVSMQDQYNLIMREEEREMFGLLADQGVGVDPVLAAGQGPGVPPVGRAHRPDGRRPGRPALRPGRRRPDRRTRSQRDRRGPRRPDGAGRARLGADATRRSPPRSSARPSRTTSATPSPRSTSS